MCFECNFFQKEKKMASSTRRKRLIRDATWVYIVAITSAAVLMFVLFRSCGKSVESYSSNLESGRFAWWSNTAAAVQDEMGECAMLLATNADDPSGLPEQCHRHLVSMNEAQEEENIPGVD